MKDYLGPIGADGKTLKNVTERGLHVKWIQLTRDGEKKSSLMNTIINLRVPYFERYFDEMGDYGKGKAFPLQAWTGPWGSQRLRLQNF
jgi:hypothetical protein